MHICRSHDLHLLLLDSSVLGGQASPESTQELVVCLEKFVMVQFHRRKGRDQLVEGGKGVGKDSGQSGLHGPLELTFAGSLIAPSTESMTRRNPNFGKTNTVSRSLFTFGICDLCVLLELVYMFLDNACNLEAKRSQKEKVPLQTAQPVYAGCVRYLQAIAYFFIIYSNLLCCRVLAPRFAQHSFTLSGRLVMVYFSDQEFSSYH